MRLIDADAVCDAIFDKTGIELYQSEWKEIEDAIESINTAMQLWTSVKDAQPDADGVYFIAYDFLHCKNLIAMRKFKNGEWLGNDCPVKFWMPIPALPEDGE